MTISRREAIALLGSLAVAPWDPRRFDAGIGSGAPAAPRRQDTISLAPGTPTSPERQALIAAFRRDAAGVDERFEAHTLDGEWRMPYRLFRPARSGTLPLVVYLHGSGGLGSDNARQLGSGNMFGTRVWALPANQERFPCFVVAPQTDRGWAKYGDPAPGDSVAQVVDGLGDGNRAALEVIEQVARTHPVDRQRIYLTGQSMGGLGVWNLLEHRPSLFAAAVTCCGSAGRESLRGITRTPLWNFHGTADQVVPVAVSRARIAALREAGGRPRHTEYEQVGHNVWEWAYTEPALLPWLFGQRRQG